MAGLSTVAAVAAPLLTALVGTSSAVRIYVANVGANESTAPALRSPIFSDGTFELVPILEEFPAAANPTYEELPSWTGRALNLAAFVHHSLRSRRAHADPEFENFTYGDTYNARCSALLAARAGDLVLFLARLWEYDGWWSRASAFYLVGQISVACVVQIAPGETPDALARRVGTDVVARMARNANYRRFLAGEGARSIVVVGDPMGSRRLERALRVDEEVVGLIYGGDYDSVTGGYRRDGASLLNKSGSPRSYRTFGSATRTIQMWLERGRDDPFLDALFGRLAACGSAARAAP